MRPDFLVGARHNLAQRGKRWIQSLRGALPYALVRLRVLQRASRRPASPSATGATEVSPARKRWVHSPREALTDRGAIPASFAVPSPFAASTRTVLILIETLPRLLLA